MTEHKDINDFYKDQTVIARHLGQLKMAGHVGGSLDATVSTYRKWSKKRTTGELAMVTGTQDPMSMGREGLSYPNLEKIYSSTSC